MFNYIFPVITGALAAGAASFVVDRGVSSPALRTGTLILIAMSVAVVANRVISRLARPRVVIKPSSLDFRSLSQEYARLHQIPDDNDELSLRFQRLRNQEIAGNQTSEGARIRAESQTVGAEIGLSVAAEALTPDLKPSELEEILARNCPVKTSETLNPADVLSSHDQAKESASQAIDDMKVGHLEFISPSTLLPCFDSSQEKVLDREIFHSSCINTGQLGRTILDEGLRLDEVHFYQIPTQCNGAVVSDGMLIPPPGKAMQASERDYTLGARAQRTNPPLFEAFNACASNGGFNMLARVLSSDLIAGPTAALHHGYIAPQQTGQWEKIADSLDQHGTKVEFPCYESVLPNGGRVHLMLCAAPMWRNAIHDDIDSEKKVQYLMARAYYIAFFQQALELIRLHPNQKIVIHPYEVGLGALCKNDPEMIAKAFREAALAFQHALIPDQKTRVQVQFEIPHIDQPNSRTHRMVGMAGLDPADRV